MLDYIVMQMRKVNREKGYSNFATPAYVYIQIIFKYCFTASFCLLYSPYPRIPYFISLLKQLR